FRVITEGGGEYFRGVHVARGVAAVDLGGRGLADLVGSHVNEPAAVLWNAPPLPAGGGHHWLGAGPGGRGHRDLLRARLGPRAGGGGRRGGGGGGGGDADAVGGGRRQLRDVGRPPPPFRAGGGQGGGQVDGGVAVGRAPPAAVGRAGGRPLLAARPGGGRGPAV